MSSSPNRMDDRLDQTERAGIRRATQAARSSGQTQWVARVSLARSIDILRCYARCGDRDRFFWERADSGERFVAWGRVDETESAGSERFRDVEVWAARIRSRLHWVGAARCDAAPVFFGGFGFDDDVTPASEWKNFPAARFVLPAAIGEFRDGRARWITLARVEPGVDADSVETELAGRLAQACAFSATQSDAQPGSDSPAIDVLAVADWPSGPEYRVRSDRAHAVFLAQVDRALEDIAAGGLEKVVLARSLQVDHDGEVDIPGLLGRLRELYPSCTLIAMGRGEDTFLAATPETLVRVAGDRVETAALAGSAPRGRTPEEDAALASALQSSAKEQVEHAHVVEALARVLAARCAELEMDDTPGLRRLFGIQHLETAVSGRLLEGEAGRDVVLELVAALHPTPAVGGVPHAHARDWLRRFEGLDRGWYASPIGWLDAAGGGDFCVALRSALIRSGSSESGRAATGRAWLFAGAGIVEGSVPAQELTETRIKLRALLAPLTEI